MLSRSSIFKNNTNCKKSFKKLQKKTFFFSKTKSVVEEKIETPFLNITSEFNMKQMTDNILAVRSYLPKNVAIAVQVQDSGYGHGFFNVLKASFQAGVSVLIVNSNEDIYKIRKIGSGATLIRNRPALWDEIKEAASFTVQETVVSVENAMELDRMSGKVARVPVNLELDFNLVSDERYGDRYVKGLNEIMKMKGINVKAISTVFDKTDNTEELKAQVELFHKVWDQLNTETKKIFRFQFADTETIMRIYCDVDIQKSFPFLKFPSLIRLKSGAYGIEPKNTELLSTMFQTLTVQTKIISFTRTPTNHVLAHIQMGYTNGYPAVSGLEVLIKGQRYSVLKVLANTSIVDITSAVDVHIGEDVIITGTQDSNTITLRDISNISSVPPLTLSTSLGANTPDISSIF